MKNEHDLAYDRQCREDIAKETARFLSIEYDKVIEYLERHDPAEANRLQIANEKMDFKELVNKNFASFTDDQLTDFLKEAGKHSRHFQEIKLKIAEEMIANRRG